MKKLLTSTLIISSMILTPTLRADDSGTNTDEYTEEQQTDQSTPDQDSSAGQAPQNDNTDENSDVSTPVGTIEAQDDNNSEEGTPVGQGAQEGTNAAKRKRWQNIALAAGAVVIAVTALILIANNDGHHKD